LFQETLFQNWIDLSNICEMYKKEKDEAG